MLECAKQSSDDPKAALRLLKTSLKTVKMCQQHSVLPLAQKILERAASYQEELNNAVASLAYEDLASVCGLRADYFVAGIALVFRLRIGKSVVNNSRQENKEMLS